MEKVSEWQPIATAPASAELELSIYDNGEHHVLDFPVGARARAGATCAPIVFFCLTRAIGGIGTARASDKQPPTSISRTSRDAARQPLGSRATRPGALPPTIRQRRAASQLEVDDAVPSSAATKAMCAPRSLLRAPQAALVQHDHVFGATVTHCVPHDLAPPSPRRRGLARPRAGALWAMP